MCLALRARSTVVLVRVNCSQPDEFVSRQEKKHTLSEIRADREIRESFPEPRDKAPATFLGHGKSFEARAKRKGSHSKAKIRIAHFVRDDGSPNEARAAWRVSAKRVEARS